MKLTNSTAPETEPSLECDHLALISELLERGQALAEALEIEMDGGGGRSAKSREAIAAWRAETRKEGK